MLDILICSIKERDFQLQKLLIEFRRQGIEPLVEQDNKEISVGAKRQKLLERATKDWVVFFDDDDWPSDVYVKLILNAINEDPEADCMGIWGKMTTNGQRPQTWCHRLGYPVLGPPSSMRNFGFDYVRPILHFNPVKREKVLQVGFKDLRFGEDVDMANRLNPLLKREVFIREPLFHYRYNNTIPHKIKYGG